MAELTRYMERTDTHSQDNALFVDNGKQKSHNPQTVQSHNASLTGSTEDLVSEEDYRRKIAILMQSIVSLDGFAGTQRKEIDIVHDLCDELETKLIEMGKANLNLYNQVLAAQRLISIRDARIEKLETMAARQPTR